MFELNSLLRNNIKKLKPYSSARDEYQGTEGVFLDANENPIGSATKQKFNRYPDPKQWVLKEKIGGLKRLLPEQIFLGNGSDEAIDMVFRSFCTPGIDNVITLPPTYGMYKVCADINDIEVREIPLTTSYQINIPAVKAAIDERTKAIWICSPNNPTGNAIFSKDIVEILTTFNGVVIIDEAYIDFAPDKSFTQKLKDYPNLIILQTFSKAWGMAALRLGMAFASAEIIAVFNKVKYPYNINELTQQMAMEALKNLLGKEMMVEEILTQRAWLEEELKKVPSVLKIYPSDANFLLLKMKDGTGTYDKLVAKKTITRDRSKVTLCEDCIRITVGTAAENATLIAQLSSI